MEPQALAAYNAKPRDARRQRGNAIEQIVKRAERVRRRGDQIAPDAQILRATQAMHSLVANASFRSVGQLDPNALADDMDGTMVAQQYAFMTDIAPRTTNMFRLLSDAENDSETITIYPLTELLASLRDGTAEKSQMSMAALQLATDIRTLLLTPDALVPARYRASYASGFFSLPNDWEDTLWFLPGPLVSAVAPSRRPGFLELVIQPCIPFSLYDDTLGAVVVAMREMRDERRPRPLLLRVGEIFGATDELALASYGFLCAIDTEAARNLRDRIHDLWRGVTNQIVFEHTQRVHANLEVLTYYEYDQAATGLRPGVPAPPYITILRRGTVMFSGRRKYRTADLRSWPDPEGGAGMSTGVYAGYAQKWFALDIANSMQYMVPETRLEEPSRLSTFCDAIGWLSIYQARRDLPLLDLGDPGVVRYLMTTLSEFEADPNRAGPYPEHLDTPGNIYNFLRTAFGLTRENEVRRVSYHSTDGAIAQFLCFMGFGGWIWPGSDDFTAEVMLCQDVTVPVEENKVRYLGAMDVRSPELAGAGGFCSPAYLQVDSLVDPATAVGEWIVLGAGAAAQASAHEERGLSVPAPKRLREHASEEDDDDVSAVSDAQIEQLLASGMSPEAAARVLLK